MPGRKDGMPHSESSVTVYNNQIQLVTVGDSTCVYRVKVGHGPFVIKDRRAMEGELNQSNERFAHKDRKAIPIYCGEHRRYLRDANAR